MLLELLIILLIGLDLFSAFTLSSLTFFLLALESNKWGSLSKLISILRSILFISLKT